MHRTPIMRSTMVFACPRRILGRVSGEKSLNKPRSQDSAHRSCILRVRNSAHQPKTNRHGGVTISTRISSHSDFIEGLRPARSESELVLMQLSLVKVAVRVDFVRQSLPEAPLPALGPQHFAECHYE